VGEAAFIMNRQQAIDRVQAREPWDVLVIGGGATGLGCGVDACSRGHRTLLLEQQDFAKGTSSRSTKLVHGGVRYLKQGNISLVLEALHERGLLCRNAPHLVHHLAFIVPVYSWWEGPFYGIGLKLYDRLAGQLGLGKSTLLSRNETLERLPTLEQSGLQGGVCYYDGQFDDSRLAINLARTIVDLGGSALNYFSVIRLIHENGLTVGVVARDALTGEEHEVRAGVVINATGVFSDAIRKMDDPHSPPVVAASQGAHLVLPREFLPGETAIMVPHTPDGRVMFAVPWHDRVLVGTTDTPVEEVVLEPRPLSGEINFILENASRYLCKDPGPGDVLSAFAGLRPLVRSGDSKNTAALSRDHTLLISDSGLLTITGGKWTTYRRMAQDTVDQAEMVGGLDKHPCRTAALRIHGCPDEPVTDPVLAAYGQDAAAIRALGTAEPAWNEPVHPSLPCLASEVVWAVRQEMASTVEDVLARRTRCLLLDARASIEVAPRIAALMAPELGADDAWARRSANDYIRMARHYLPDTS
jgi:glycerol-3-phosphate dehydrogenase